jgi:tetratricopeptide (TPR) repeat protein
LKDYNGAILDFNAVIKLETSNADAYYFRGNAKEELKKFKSALDDYGKAIHVNATNSNYFLRRGNLKIIMGLTESGCNDLKKYNEIATETEKVKIKSPCK